MSYPTQGQPGDGVPQPPYGDPTQPAGVPTQPAYSDPALADGAPTQPAYGDPNQQHGVPPQQPYGAPNPYPMAGQQPPVQGSNGLATAGLVLGILPTGPLGLIFSILGLVRAPKVGGAGKVRAWVGLVLSVLWIIGGVSVFALGVKQAVTCNQTDVSVNKLAQQAETDASAGNKTAYESDVQQIINQLRASAGKVSDKSSATDLRKLASDFQTVLDDTKSGTTPPAALGTQIDSDVDAVNSDCGDTNTK